MNSRELEVLKSAILQEIQGKEFYMLAAEKAVDDEIKSVFRFLAQEEEKHSAVLIEAYNNISQNLPFAEPTNVENAAYPEAFQEAKLQEAGTLVVSALHIGVMLEKSLADFYRQAVSTTNNMQLKKLYNLLADWEDTHLKQLEGYYETARNEWWEQQQFSPA